ncbi:MAG TPA: hypothetical protein VHC96_22450 [Puia sp.]|nr:hypothetical protein [Puia sp.]
MKRLLLTIISTSILLLLLAFTNYRDWFLDKPLDYWYGFCTEVRHRASLEEVRRIRYGLPYTLSMKIQEAAKAGHLQDPVFLFEPNSFYHDSLHIDLRMPEPAVFYYFTGLQSVWMNSPTVQKANYLVIIRKGKVKIERIGTPRQLQEILTHYRSFTPIL